MQDFNVTASYGRSRQTKASRGTLLRIPSDLIAKMLASLGLLTEDLEYHLMRGSMVLIFLMFGYRNGSNMRRKC